MRKSCLCVTFATLLMMGAWGSLLDIVLIIIMTLRSRIGELSLPEIVEG